VLAYRTGGSPRVTEASRTVALHLEPLFTGRTAIDNQPTLYICQNFACQRPIIAAESIRQAIGRLSGKGT
jgi:uncharacterized protein YyaL (SSP411 family)